MTAKDICKRCTNEAHEREPNVWSKWGSSCDVMWLNACNGKGSWHCSVLFMFIDDREIERDSFPPRWCKYATELVLVMQDDKHHPQRTVR